MKLTYHNIFKSALFALAVPLSLASCSFDGDYDDCADQAGDVKTVRLQITANDPDEVAGTRFSPAEDEIKGNEAGKDGEYINSLDIFIVSSATSNNVVYASHLDAKHLGEEAANGKLKSYTSGPIELTDDTPYTVYAFANMSTTYSSDWAGIETIGEGGTLSAFTLNAIMLDDPAGKIDKSSNFIPMSATQTIESLSSPVIEVSLDRLVSKIRLAIKKDENVNVTSLKISGWADKVPLMDNATVSGEAYDCEKTFSGSDLVLTETDGTYSKDFYVNESPKGHNFNVEVTTDEPGTPTYTATTVRDNIPRNCIYPLTLNLSDLDLQLTAGFYFNVIGARVPLEVTNSGKNEFDIDIPDGMEFYIDAEMMSQTSNTYTYTYNWEIEGGTQDGFTLLDYDNGKQVTSFTGYHVGGTVPALGLAEGNKGGTYALDLNVTWGANRRSYTVNITHIWFDEAYWIDQIMKAASRSADAVSLQSETLNMVISK